ncbi:MAG: M1 family metallopeptidase [Actinomycetota bacterium]|nr:M1 family metallopeptidase [Actinomycetota bacterium]
MTAAAGVALALGMLPAGASARLPAPAPTSVGSPGIGDPYFPKYGNGGYRVRHYDVRVAFDPASERLTGDTTVIGRATKQLSRFNLDLVLHASSVRVNGTPASFRQTRRELVVTPRATLRKGQPMRVRVRYAGVPKEIADGGIRPWFTTPDGALAVGEPEIAAWWFPSNDHPADKATFDVDLTVPRHLQAVSNGRLIGVDRADGQATWRWTSGAPMATYLAFAAFGRYDIVQGTTDSGRPFLHAFAKGLAPRVDRAARVSIRRTGEVTDFLARIWGRYPFQQIGGVVPSRNFGFALENQTRPVYSPAFFSFGRDTSVVVHEMAHQWFGDAVTIRRWQHIWLNEGFATYSEWLWAQDQGFETTDEQFDRYYDSFGPRNSFWNLPIGDPGPDRLFASVVYDRGAMTVHALGVKVGHQALLRIGRQWVHRNPDGVGSTAEFIALAERISGRGLDGFFQDWLFSGEKPPRP